MRNIDELKQAWAEMQNEVGAENVLDYLALSKDEWRVFGAFCLENCLEADPHQRQIFSAMMGYGVKQDG